MRFFSYRKVLLPVIHIAYTKQVLRNCRTAVEAGADGVFLINHQDDANTLLECYMAARRDFPDLWIGLNFLDIHDPAEAFRILPESSDGLWVDNAQVRALPERQAYIQSTRSYINRCRGKKTYFGGVCFKYQVLDPDPAEAAIIAADLMDVVTTSGTRTGSAPDLEKIRSMKEAIGIHSLAIASGITAENIGLFLPYVDFFLVATGISRDMYNLSPARTKKLADIIHSVE